MSKEFEMSVVLKAEVLKGELVGSMLPLVRMRKTDALALSYTFTQRKHYALVFEDEQEAMTVWNEWLDTLHAPELVTERLQPKAIPI